MTDAILYVPVASASGGDARGDYFTVADYRSVTGDRTIPYQAEDDDITRAQEEVVERLEAWARTSWVTRSATYTTISTVGLIQTRYIPIVEGSVSITLDGTALLAGDYTIDHEAGTIRYGDWNTDSVGVLRPAVWVVTYQYGWGSVPWSVRRPCIHATESLVKLTEQRAKVPRNTNRYGSERSDLTVGRRGAYKPWPWDSRSTDDIRALWDNERPRGLMTSL